MGLILDSSFIIAGERRGRTALQILQDIKATQGEIDGGISVVTIAELIGCGHAQRATLPEDPRAEGRFSHLLVGAFLAVRLF